MTWETLLGLLKRPNLKEKETFRRPSRLEKVTIDNYRFRFLSFYFQVGRILCLKSPLFFLQKNTICQKIYREFLARPPYQYWSIPYLRNDFYRGMAVPPLPTLGTVSLST